MQKVVLLVLVVCAMILFPVPPSCPSRFPQLGPCCTLSLLLSLFHAGAALIEAVNQLAGAVDINDGWYEPRGSREKKTVGETRKNLEQNNVLNNGWATR